MDIAASPSTIIVRTRDGSDLSEHLEIISALGEVELIPPYHDRCLVKLHATTEDARANWERVQDQLGPDFEVGPVLHDDRGNTKYPLGTITVRFKEVPTEDELTKCEENLDLRVKARNKYIPSQVTFEATKPRYLLETLESIEQRVSHVDRVWPDTLSKYRREKT